MEKVLDPQVLKALSRPAMLPWLLRAFSDWAQIIVAFWCAHHFNHPVVYVLVWFFLGIKINAMGLLIHDVAHFGLSSNHKINNLVGHFIVGMPLAQSISGYRRFHFNHHRYQGTSRDPEIAYQSSRKRWARPLTKGRVAYIFITDMLGLGIPDIIAGMKDFKPEKIYEPITSTLFLVGIFALGWKLQVLWIPSLWIVAGLTSHWAFFRLRTLTEHAGVDSTLRIEDHRFFQMLLFPHNTHMHYEHHAYPTVPLWNLKKLRESMNDKTPLIKAENVVKKLAEIPAMPW